MGDMEAYIRCCVCHQTTELVAAFNGVVDAAAAQTDRELGAEDELLAQLESQLELQARSMQTSPHLLTPSDHYSYCRHRGQPAHAIVYIHVAAPVVAAPTQLMGRR